MGYPCSPYIASRENEDREDEDSKPAAVSAQILKESDSADS